VLAAEGRSASRGAPLQPGFFAWKGGCLVQAEVLIRMALGRGNMAVVGTISRRKVLGGALLGGLGLAAAPRAQSGWPIGKSG
jgi:hypothetical protein